jgi:hypothetical protein
MYRVASVNELYADLDRIRSSKPLLYPGIEDSPYFIDTTSLRRKAD